MKKKIAFSFLTVFSLCFLLIKQAFAICPLCTIVVGAGVGLSRWLGVDDTISGLWVGGTTVSLIVWTIFWLEKKKFRFYGRKIIITLSYYLLIIAPLYYTEIVGHPFNRLWGIDKLILGIFVGSIAFALGGFGYVYLKAKNNDKAYFPFQKIVMPVAPLIILTIVFYCITKCN